MAYRSASKEQARVSQVLSGEKRDPAAMPVIEAFPEGRDLSDAVRRLTQIINTKQQLIVGITQKLGEFVGAFRGIRKGLDDIKAGKVDQTVTSAVDSYCCIITTKIEE